MTPLTARLTEIVRVSEKTPFTADEANEFFNEMERSPRFIAAMARVVKAAKLTDEKYRSAPIERALRALEAIAEEEAK